MTLHSLALPILATLAAGALTIAPAAAVTIFSDDFSGGGGSDLNGTTPDVTTGGASWVALSNFKDDGSVSGGGSSSGRGSATLAFTPVNGLIYNLDVSYGPTSFRLGDGNDNDWLAVGFARGQDSADNGNNRFITGTVVGVAWFFQRGPNGGPNQAFLGDEGANNPGLASGAQWADLTNVNGGNTDFRIILDTTGGTGFWTATMLAKESASSSYTVVRGTQTLLTDNITSVGLARSSGDINGTVTNFSLTSVPEPSSLALIGLGGLTLLRRRRC